MSFPLIIAVTGGVATGKSTFTRFLVGALDAEHFCADTCVGNLLDTDMSVREAITAQIHPAAYLPSGLPARNLLRRLVFDDPEVRRTLETILHPRVHAIWKARAEACTIQHRYFVAEIPLLFESNSEKFFDRVVCVASSEEVCLARLLARPEISRPIAEKIISAQMPLSEKIEKANHVVWNDGSLEALADQAQILATQFTHA